MPLLEITNLVKRLGRNNAAQNEQQFTLRIPHFALEQGAELVLTGASGSGKTTLLNLICGIIAPDEGSIKLLNTNIVGLTEAARDRFRAGNIGIVYQAFNLLQGFTALENVMLGAAFQKGNVDIPVRSEELLVRLGLKECLRRKPAELSIGQQQRVAVARALISKPALILADEPTASIDEANSATVIEEIRSLAREQGSTLLVVSHDKNIAQMFPATQAIHDFIAP
ncbi:MAG: ABC transporter ATP-binding protein [Candidatus Kapabacteria bacterium]|jgi:putative ABC transport system ATP-binding protein|nr:ABC transporter ATP-binding protein [Candidatus Kapabacteria bacterium]